MGIIFGLASFIFCFTCTVYTSGNKYFTRYNNKRVSGVFLEGSAESGIHCNALCSDVETCRSVNYHHNTKECQLSSALNVDIDQTASGWASFIQTELANANTQNNPDIPECGDVYTNYSGIIQSPNYPNIYGDNTDCAWVIFAPENNQVVLTINDLSTQPHALCEYDFIQVRDGSDKTSPLLGIFCGYSYPNTVTTCSASSMRIEFQTNHEICFRGFKVSWGFQSNIGTCGCNYYNVNSGTIMSPNYPGDYNNSNDCVWVIRTFRGPITLNFTDFYTEDISDTVQVCDGIDGSATSLGTFYGSTLPEQLMSTGSALYIRFITDDMVIHRGFKAIWQAVRMQAL